MALLLGLTGGRGSGKDTAFEFIDTWTRARAVTACRRSFADKLKHSACLALGFDVEEADAIVLMDELKDMGEITTVIPSQSVAYTITGRKFLQLFGTEAHRDLFGPGFWVDALLPTFTPDGYDPDVWHESFLGADVCVVADVRFRNEAARVHELGGLIWKIDRDTEVSDDHVSEWGLPDADIDLVIDNHGTLAEFQDSVVRALYDQLAERPPA